MAGFLPHPEMPDMQWMSSWGGLTGSANPRYFKNHPQIRE